MVSSPVLQGTFDSGIDATVSIAEILDSTTNPITLGNTIAQFSRSSGTVAVDASSYQVNWQLGDFDLSVDHEYRITVTSGAKVMGIADVLILANASQVKNVTTDDVIPLVDNRTLPIRFWMNGCAPVVCGDCEVANSCDPATTLCAPLAAGTSCRPSAGDCDPAEVCTGSGGNCPSDAMIAAGTVCRASTGECDPAETCSGDSPSCPSDALAASGTACSSDGDFCTADACDGTSAICRHSDAQICARDWTQFPAVVEMDGAPELWVMSDAHGDYDAYTRLLFGAGILGSIPSRPVVPATVQWNAGHAVLVIVGDLIDKGPFGPDVVRLTSALQSAAALQGGRVIVTMGNHEIEFLADPENSKATDASITPPYTTPNGIDPQLIALGYTPEQTAAGDNDVGQFIRQLPYAARVNNWFFVHGGKTDGRSIAQLTHDLQGSPGQGLAYDAFFSGLTATNGNIAISGGVNALAYDSGPSGSMLEARLSATGPQWWDASGNAPALLSSWTANLGVSHLVMGHQPAAVGFAASGGFAAKSRAKDQMFQYYGGLIFLVDTGLSIGADQTGSKTPATDGIMHVMNPGGPGETWEKVLPSGSHAAF